MSSIPNPALANIQNTCPTCIRERRQWVAWKYIERDGKPTKAPINPHDGSLAASTDAATWGSFIEAVEACRKDSNLSGIGFVFTPNDPYCGVDLDDCIDPESGQLKPWAAQFVALLDSYAEVSPSGTGVKVFLKANKPGRRCRKGYEDGGIEIYDRDRFFTVTGDRLQGFPTEVNLRQEALDLVYASVFGGDEPGAACKSRLEPSPPTDDCATVVLSDDEIVELACNKPKTGEKFQSLWNGNWNDHFNSASEADSSVVFSLAYYTKDAHQLDRMFRQSRLMRPKWDEMHGNETYGATTIAKALSNVVKQYPAKARRRAARRPSPPSIGIPKSGIDWEF
ncbi:MAG TPA: hypothetical protein VM260_06495 [Pirellula sp.]|nr:hypothetical protein [Pirellula sp.]